MGNNYLMSDDENFFARNVKRAMKARGMSLRAFAQAAGVNYETLRNPVTRGIVKDTRAVADAVAAYLNVSSDDIRKVELDFSESRPAQSAPQQDPGPLSARLLGARLRFIREDGLAAVAAVAEFLGFRPHEWQEIEDGKRSIDVDSLVKFSSKFDVDTDFFLKGNAEVLNPRQRQSWKPPL